MVRTTGRPLRRRIAAIAVGLLAPAAVAVPFAPAQAQYWAYYPTPPRAYYTPYRGYYPYRAYYPPYWSYSPYGHALLNDPYYPCIWEGRGCPTGR